MLKLERSMAFSSPYMQYAPEPKPDMHRVIVTDDVMCAGGLLSQIVFVAEAEKLSTLNNALRENGYADLLKTTKKVANGKN